MESDNDNIQLETNTKKDDDNNSSDNIYEL